MKKILALLIAAAMIIVLYSLTDSCECDDPRAPCWIPVEVFGEANVPPESTLLAYTDGESYTTAYWYNNNYCFDLVWDNEMHSPDMPDNVKDGYYTDDMVYFAYKAGGKTYFASQVIYWHLCDSYNFNMNFIMAGGPEDLKINEVCTDDGDGSQYARIYNPSSVCVDLGDYYLEKDIQGNANSIPPYCEDYHGDALNLTGTIAPGHIVHVDLPGGFLDKTADELKLAWQNPGTAIAAGNDIVIDRVEYGNQEDEPDNTIMGDAPAPPAGYCIVRRPVGMDTDDCSADFRIKHAKEVTYEMPLKAGWNLISLPLVQNDTSIQTVFSSIDGLWDNAKYYDSTDALDPWKSHRPGFATNDLNDIDHTMAIWLHLTADATLFVNGTVPEDVSINLYAGWNFIGYPVLDNKTVEDTLGGTGYDHVEVYDQAMPYLLSEVGSEYIIQTGEGLWVHVPSDSVLMLEN